MYAQLDLVAIRWFGAESARTVISVLAVPLRHRFTGFGGAGSAPAL